MKRESLRNLRTMREVRSSLEASRPDRGRTTNSLHKDNNEENTASPPDPKIRQILLKEKMRSAAFEASVAKSQERMLRLRDKLAATIKQNEELTRLRKQMQKARWEDKSPSGEPAAKKDGFNTVELKF